ncbi:MAG: SusD/RagB family nutrient-binding outer membrane lipoprotein [Bacteroidales bacterium]|nr:SusD/RagB family nutrient-binding outer membrane lipoprotein [Bacteroidales bacterium]
MQIIQYIAKIFLMIIILGVLTMSCQKKLDDLKKNPNAVTSVDDAALFTNATRSLFIGTADESASRFIGQHAHYFVAGGDYRKPDLYGDGFDTQYEEMMYNIYGSTLRHIEDVLVLTSTGDTKNETRFAMATVISVLGFQKLTDLYGDIPYTEGGKGKQGILQPKYDTQEFVYKDMIDRLTASIDVLKTANPDNAYGVSDFIYANDLDKWVRFANSVRLRLAMRLRDADQAYSRTMVSLCLQDPLMENYTDDASMIDTEGYGNVWYDKKTSYPGIKMSEMFISQLVNTSDPRLNGFADKDIDGGYSGQLNGLSDEEFGSSNWPDRSDIGDALASQDSKFYLMTATEIWFLRAEAALVYQNDESAANENFRTGIEVSLNQWQVEQDSIAEFLASPTATLSGNMAQKEAQIGMQMWIAIMPNYVESWAHMRRTGYPVIAQRTDPRLDQGVTDGYMPRRFKYSSFELSTNGDNTQEAIDRQGPNTITTPVWWDRNN